MCGSSLTKRRVYLSVQIRNAGLVLKKRKKYFVIHTNLDRRADRPRQFRAIGWVKGRLYSVILEIRQDKGGEYYRLVTLWKATAEEQTLYEENL